MPPTCRSYSKPFKTQVIQKCAQPGASIASVAFSHSLNASLVHKWIREQTQNSMALQPAFILVPMQSVAQGTAKIIVKILYSRGTAKLGRTLTGMLALGRRK
ncbi:transposase [Pseudomonas trivialis]|uniref:Transposase n=1 Tax=Pseudomonas trivialis TaxID=200450 RepID=A0ABY0USC2_9PSED|nr:transposase [Pseudomonas trivialis]SDT11133.1 Transposase [Pseudomonas trivialis]